MAKKNETQAQDVKNTESTIEYTIGSALELVNEARELNESIKDWNRNATEESQVKTVSLVVNFGGKKGKKATEKKEQVVGALGYDVVLKTVRGKSYLTAQVKGVSASKSVFKMTGSKDGLVKLTKEGSDIPMDDASTALLNSLDRAIWTYFKAISIPSKKYQNVLKDYYQILESRVKKATTALSDAMDASGKEEEGKEEEKLTA